MSYVDAIFDKSLKNTTMVHFFCNVNEAMVLNVTQRVVLFQSTTKNRLIVDLYFEFYWYKITKYQNRRTRIGQQNDKSKSNNYKNEAQMRFRAKAHHILNEYTSNLKQTHMRFRVAVCKL